MHSFMLTKFRANLKNPFKNLILHRANSMADLTTGSLLAFLHVGPFSKNLFLTRVIFESFLKVTLN